VEQMSMSMLVTHMEMHFGESQCPVDDALQWKYEELQSRIDSKKYSLDHMVFLCSPHTQP